MGIQVRPRSGVDRVGGSTFFPPAKSRPALSPPGCSAKVDFGDLESLLSEEAKEAHYGFYDSNFIEIPEVNPRNTIEVESKGSKGKKRRRRPVIIVPDTRGVMQRSPGEENRE